MEFSVGASTVSLRPVRSSPSKNAVQTRSKPRPQLLAALRKRTSSSASNSASEDETSESDEDLHASFISQFKSNPNLSQKSRESDEESDGAAAYERMKKRMAATKPTSCASGKEAMSTHVPAVRTIASSEDDEDVAPVRGPIRQTIATKDDSMAQPSSPAQSPYSRRSSPGLFMTPYASPEKRTRRHSNPSESEADDGSQIVDDPSLQLRIERIRKERLASNRAQDQQQKHSSKQRAEAPLGSDTDSETGRKLTQQAKPTRRAGKKAMEIMARDQQRISRNMQLTHQAKTKKKHTKQDLFARLGYNWQREDSIANQRLPTPEACSVPVSSDAEASQAHDTPPTSPDELIEESENHLDGTDRRPAAVMKQADASSLQPSKLDKGKGRAPEYQHLPPRPWMLEDQKHATKIIQTQAVHVTDSTMVDLSDSDDEVEKIQSRSRFPIFDRIPIKKQKESAALLRQRHLAHLTSPKNSRKGPKTISRAEMEMNLAQKARQQGLREREEKIAELKARGIHIQTEEEREKYQMEVDDVMAQLEKQRQKDAALAKSEIDKAKKNGEFVDDLPSSDESDDDFVGSDEEVADEAENDSPVEELELSGSEDEELEVTTEDDAELETSPQEPEPIPQNDADNAVHPEQLEEGDGSDDDITPVHCSTNARKRQRIIEEDEESGAEEHIAPEAQSQATQDDGMAAFGFGDANVGMGLTQMFAGTMADMHGESQSVHAQDTEVQQDSLEFLRDLPKTQPVPSFTQTSDFVIPNSQSLTTPRKKASISDETPLRLGISRLIETSPAFSRTQMEDLPEPTQDAGFSFSRFPVGQVAPPSTIDTVMIPIAESPVKQHKGKLQRGRKEATVELSDVEEDMKDAQAVESEEDDIQRPPKPRDAFSKLKKGAKNQKALDSFNKKTSMAKDAVMEQAEESEDEYAGLGGISDDDSGEEDAELDKMIDHTEVDVDERQLAAFYADKAKKEDEKSFNELYKTITTGGLRKRAGGRDGFDLSDSEDEADLRRRKKQDEFRKMSKALLSDERISKIAENRKTQAFVRTLADFADEEDQHDFLDFHAEIMHDEASQSQSQSQNAQPEQPADDIAIPDSQTTDSPTLTNPLKRKSTDSQKENRPPPNLRRTAPTNNLIRKPMTHAEIQHSISEVLEDPRVMVPDSQYSSDSDADDNNDSVFTTPSTTTRRASRQPIIDRLSLSRSSTVDEQPATEHNANLAFHAPSRTTATSGFRIPSLIRQATSNLSTKSDASGRSGSGAGAHTPSESSGVTIRRGGTGKSNIHAQAREAERRAALEKVEGRRREKEKGRRRRGGRSVLGDLGGGFE